MVHIYCGRGVVSQNVYDLCQGRGGAEATDLGRY